jgi:hypothetical protein
VRASIPPRALALDSPELAGSGMGNGAIIGIAAGSAAALALLVGATLFVIRKRGMSDGESGSDRPAGLERSSAFGESVQSRTEGGEPTLTFGGEGASVLSTIGEEPYLELADQAAELEDLWL